MRLGHCLLERRATLALPGPSGLTGNRGCYDSLCELSEADGDSFPGLPSSGLQDAAGREQDTSGATLRAGRNRLPEGAASFPDK